MANPKLPSRTSSTMRIGLERNFIQLMDLVKKRLICLIQTSSLPVNGLWRSTLSCRNLEKQMKRSYLWKQGRLYWLKVSF
uniref:Mitochondrial ribosomal protein S23 n=1 Tax=Rousettus aegyptiacus TaxID=9407 RepID=A0A7J8GBZ5_ROUAE|nr:mitochondrial ribosomal protein S23 [Rousettus aegyptiacus]